MNFEACHRALVSRARLNANHTTHQAHQAAQATAVASARSSAELALNDHLHDRHRSAVDSFLLVSRGRAARGVEELAGLLHGEADQV